MQIVCVSQITSMMNVGAYPANQNFFIIIGYGGKRHNRPRPDTAPHLTLLTGSWKIGSNYICFKMMVGSRCVTHQEAMSPKWQQGIISWFHNDGGYIHMA